MQYKILKFTGIDFSKALKTLEESVNSDIKCGWRPQGGVSMAEETSLNGFKNLIVVQAMVKED